MKLLQEIVAARNGKGLSQSDLADRTGVARLAIARLETGIGSTTRLLAVMAELEVRLSGIARGPTLPAQLRARRLRLGWTVADVANRAGLTSKTVEAVEVGKGSVASLLKLLAVVAPKATRSQACSIIVVLRRRGRWRARQAFHARLVHEKGDGSVWRDRSRSLCAPVVFGPGETEDHAARLWPRQRMVRQAGLCEPRHTRRS